MHTPIKHIWLFNGPARSGKDTLAALVRRHFTGHTVGIEKFARPLKEGGTAALGIPLAELEDKWKETVIPGLDVTWRNYQISMSEDWYKPTFGEDIFGRLLVERIKREALPLYAISDSGFTVEARPVIDYFGPDCVSIFHIHRPHHTFEGDSRQWVDSESLGVPYFHLMNDQMGNPGRLLGDFLTLIEEHNLY